MRRILILLGLGITLCSCQKSFERLIKSEFMTYVENNFDDPEAISEIVSIMPSDTISIMRLKSSIETMHHLIVGMDSLERFRDSMILVRINNLKSKSYSYSHSDRILGQIYGDRLSELMLLRFPLVHEKSILTDRAEKLMDSFIYEAPKYGYEIKYRQKVNGELKMNNYYGYIDSLSRNVIVLPTQWMQKDSHASKQQKDFEEVIDEYINLLDKKKDNYDNIEELMKKIEAL